MAKRYRTVLSIAGSDSSGGAGIQADIKTISACGCYAMTVITAITAQNTTGVKGIHVVPAETVARQMTAVAEDIHIDAVKLGMLPDAGIVTEIAELLQKYNIKNIVLDPVMVATSGDRLISEEAVEAIKEHLFPLCTLVTPNIPETEFLTGEDIRSEDIYPDIAAIFRSMGVKNVLIKSGHLDGEYLYDCLFEGKDVYKYGYDRIVTPNTHGTGCTLSSAVASFLAHGYSLPEAVGMSEDYIHKAILNGADYEIGKGQGPVHHFYRFWDF